MPDLDQWEQEDSALCKLLGDTTELATSGALQNLETLYVCSPMSKFPRHPSHSPAYMFSVLGFNDYREYELDLRRIIPFMGLPNMRSLYSLTPYVYWENPNSPLDFEPLKHTSNITTLVYDESVLAPFDVIESLSMFNALKSFRWTTSKSGYGDPRKFVAFQYSLGNALMTHKDSLEELYFDSRHSDAITWETVSSSEHSKNGILIGSLREYQKLRSLAIDVNSLCGHQKWTTGPPLRDSLPRNLESLTLFVKIHQTKNAEGVKETTFDNALWYLNFLDLIRDVGSRLPRLRGVSIRLTSNEPHWTQTEYDLELDLSLFQQAINACAEAGIGLDIEVAVQVLVDKQRKNGLTTIPYFLDQIKVRNPGRDF